MSANNWISAQVRRPLLNEVREFLKTDSAKRAGLTNSTQFIDVALKDLLERLKPESMMVGGMHDDRIELKDWDAEKQMVQLSVYFDRDGGPFCTYCKESVCIHVQYAWEVPERGPSWRLTDRAPRRPGSACRRGRTLPGSRRESILGRMTAEPAGTCTRPVRRGQLR